jgi:hypothetical protein
LCSVSQAVVTGVARVWTINQLNAADHAADALRFGADIYGVYFDIFDARTNAAVSRRLSQVKCWMRNGVAIPIPSGMFANDNGVIDLAGFRQLFFLCPCFARKARKEDDERGKRREKHRATDCANRLASPPF